MIALVVYYCFTFLLITLGYIHYITIFKVADVNNCWDHHVAVRLCVWSVFEAVTRKLLRGKGCLYFLLTYYLEVAIKSS